MKSNLSLAFGPHCLGAFRPGYTANDLYEDALRERNRGATLYEVGTRQLTGLSAAETAKALLDAGIKRAVKSRFFPEDRSWGDPLAGPDGSSYRQAVDTIVGDADYLAEMSQAGVDIDLLAGPLYHCVGRTSYRAELDSGAIWIRGRDFMQHVAQKTAAHKTRFAVEPLRGAEAVGIETSVPWLQAMLANLKGRAGILLDVHHEFDRGRDPANEILKADRGWLLHAHLHGYNRVPAGAYVPGSKFHTDPINWWQVRCALEAIGYTGTVVGEPFGPGIRKVAPSLGVGIPEALPPEEFYAANWAHLTQMGIIQATAQVS